MGKVSESIWSNNEVIIPMAEVSHMEKNRSSDRRFKDDVLIVFKHSKFNNETDCHEPTVYLQGETAIQFKKDWCMYRHELEFETLNTSH